MTASMADLSYKDNLKTVYDILQINCARPNKEEELHAQTLSNLAGWINKNKPLVNTLTDLEYQIDRTKPSSARAGLIEALQNGWLNGGHPVFKTDEDFMQSRKILNASAHKITVYHKVRHHSSATTEPQKAVTASHITGTTKNDILDSARAKSDELKRKIEELKSRKNSGDRTIESLVTFEQMLAGIKAAVEPLKETMATLQTGIEDIKKQPTVATLDAEALQKIADTLCANTTFTTSISLALTPFTEKAVQDAEKAVTASNETKEKVTTIEARLARLEGDFKTGEAKIIALESSSTNQLTVDLTSNDALIRAYGEFTRGSKEYSADVEARSRLGIVRVTVLGQNLMSVENGVKVPKLNNVAALIGSNFTTLSAVTENKNGNLSVLIKLTQATATLTKQKFEQILENRKNFKGEIALSTTTPPQHLIDTDLMIWKSNNVVFKYDTTKKGFYIIHLNDGLQSLLAVTAPAQPTRESITAYENTCTRLNVHNPRELAKLNMPSLTALRKIVRRSHFTLHGQVVQNPVWSNPRPNNFVPFISTHFIDGSDEAVTA